MNTIPTAERRRNGMALGRAITTVITGNPTPAPSEIAETVTGMRNTLRDTDPGPGTEPAI